MGFPEWLGEVDREIERQRSGRTQKSALELIYDVNDLTWWDWWNAGVPAAEAAAKAFLNQISDQNTR
jgi:hypothetical protein